MIIEALQSDSNLKILCACIALQRNFNQFFLEDYMSYPPKHFKHKREMVSDKLIRLCHALKSALLREVNENEEYFEKAFDILLEVFDRTNRMKEHYLPTVHAGLCRII